MDGSRSRPSMRRPRIPARDHQRDPGTGQHQERQPTPSHAAIRRMDHTSRALGIGTSHGHHITREQRRDDCQEIRGGSLNELDSHHLARRRPGPPTARLEVPELVERSPLHEEERAEPEQRQRVEVKAMTGRRHRQHGRTSRPQQPVGHSMTMSAVRSGVAKSLPLSRVRTGAIEPMVEGRRRRTSRIARPAGLALAQQQELEPAQHQDAAEDVDQPVEASRRPIPPRTIAMRMARAETPPEEERCCSAAGSPGRRRWPRR